MQNQEKLIDTKKVYTEKKDMTLSDIRNKVDNGDIELQPDYQRNYVIEDKSILKSKLIESILMGIPIPIVYFAEEENGILSIIDGQQRIRTIHDFLQNKFMLKGLEELGELNGCTFNTLPKNNQRILENATLSCIILSKESQELKYEIFARLNQGSTKLKPQELRNCIYRGSFNNLLKTLSENKKLPKLFKTTNKRMDYEEYILRFFALRDYHNYGSSMGKTMNLYMAKHQNDTEKEINQLKTLFNKTIDNIDEILGEEAFCAYDRQNQIMMNKFSGSVYDSIIIAISFFSSHDLSNYKDKIREFIIEMKKNNEEYQNYTYAATGSKERVIGRILLIYNNIRRIIGKNGDLGNVRFFSSEDKEKLWYDGYICPYCNQIILSIDDAEVDHITPYSKGGETTIKNAQLLHRSCNRRKSNKIDDNDSRENE